MGNQFAACCTSGSDAYYVNVSNGNCLPVTEVRSELHSMTFDNERRFVGLAAREAASRKAAHMAVLDYLPESHVDLDSNSDSADVGAMTTSGVVSVLQQSTVDELLFAWNCSGDIKAKEQLEKLLAAGYSDYDAIVLMLNRKEAEMQIDQDERDRVKRERVHDEQVEEEEECRRRCEEEADLLAREEQLYQQRVELAASLADREAQQEHFQLCARSRSHEDAVESHRLLRSLPRYARYCSSLDNSACHFNVEEAKCNGASCSLYEDKIEIEQADTAPVYNDETASDKECDNEEFVYSADKVLPREEKVDFVIKYRKRQHGHQQDMVADLTVCEDRPVLDCDSSAGTSVLFRQEDAALLVALFEEQAVVDNLSSSCSNSSIEQQYDAGMLREASAATVQVQHLTWKDASMLDDREQSVHFKDDDDDDSTAATDDDDNAESLVHPVRANDRQDDKDTADFEDLIHVEDLSQFNLYACEADNTPFVLQEEVVSSMMDSALQRHDERDDASQIDSDDDDDEVHGKEEFEQAELMKQEWQLEVAQEREFERIRALEQEEKEEELERENEREQMLEREIYDAGESEDSVMSEIELQNDVSVEEENSEKSMLSENESQNDVSLEEEEIEAEEVHVEEERLDD